MFPTPSPVAKRRCAECGTPTRVDRLWAGAYGEDCAEKLGFKVTKTKHPAVQQTGPDLFDAAAGRATTRRATPQTTTELQIQWNRDLGRSQ
jgi:hypothetical protein